MTPVEVREADVAPGRMELESWRDLGLVAGITTRHGDQNLGFGTGEAAGQVWTRWRTFLQEMGPRFPGAVLSHQVHGASLALHSAQPVLPGLRLLDGFDGHLTNTPGLLLLATVADCVPVYLAHPQSRWLALVHAGWRGVAAGAVEGGIRQLAECAGCSPSDIVIHCGVSVCGKCYEVGPEVVHAVCGKDVPGPSHVDLREQIVARAEAAGVRRVSVSTWCAAHDAERFFSHRRSGGRDGRMVAYLGWPAT